MRTDLKVTLRRCACGGDAYLAIVEHGEQTIAVTANTPTLRSSKPDRVAALEQSDWVLPWMSGAQWRALIGAEL